MIRRPRRRGSLPPDWAGRPPDFAADLSRASVAQDTTWNGSVHRMRPVPGADDGADLARAVGGDVGQGRGPVGAQGVENPARVFMVPAGGGPDSRPLSWSTTTTRYLWPLR